MIFPLTVCKSFSGDDADNKGFWKTNIDMSKDFERLELKDSDGIDSEDVQKL
jgi:hypothetical protein